MLTFPILIVVSFSICSTLQFLITPAGIVALAKIQQQQVKAASKILELRAKASLATAKSRSNLNRPSTYRSPKLRLRSVNNEECAENVGFDDENTWKKDDVRHRESETETNILSSPPIASDQETFLESVNTESGIAENSNTEFLLCPRYDSFVGQIPHFPVIEPVILEDIEHLHSDNQPLKTRESSAQKDETEKVLQNLWNFVPFSNSENDANNFLGDTQSNSFDEAQIEDQTSNSNEKSATRHLRPHKFVHTHTFTHQHVHGAVPSSTTSSANINTLNQHQNFINPAEVHGGQNTFAASNFAGQSSATTFSSQNFNSFANQNGFVVAPSTVIPNAAINTFHNNFPSSSPINLNLNVNQNQNGLGSAGQSSITNANQLNQIQSSTNIASQSFQQTGLNSFSDQNIISNTPNAFSNQPKNHFSSVQNVQNFAVKPSQASLSSDHIDIRDIPGQNINGLINWNKAFPSQQFTKIVNGPDVVTPIISNKPIILDNHLSDTSSVKTFASSSANSGTAGASSFINQVTPQHPTLDNHFTDTSSLETFASSSANSGTAGASSFINQVTPIHPTLDNHFSDTSYLKTLASSSTSSGTAGASSFINQAAPQHATSNSFNSNSQYNGCSLCANGDNSNHYSHSQLVNQKKIHEAQTSLTEESYYNAGQFTSTAFQSGSNQKFENTAYPNELITPRGFRDTTAERSANFNTLETKTSLHDNIDEAQENPKIQTFEISSVNPETITFWIPNENDLIVDNGPPSEDSERRQEQSAEPHLHSHGHAHFHSKTIVHGNQAFIPNTFTQSQVQVVQPVNVHVVQNQNAFVHNNPSAFSYQNGLQTSQIFGHENSGVQGQQLQGPFGFPSQQQHSFVNGNGNSVVQNQILGLPSQFYRESDSENVDNRLTGEDLSQKLLKANLPRETEEHRNLSNPEISKDNFNNTQVSDNEEQISSEDDNLQKLIDVPFNFRRSKNWRPYYRKRRSDKSSIQDLDDILMTQRKMVDTLQKDVRDDKDLLMIGFIGDSLLNDLELRKNLTINHTRIKRQLHHGLPLTRLVSDPNARLDISKTLENIGTVTRHTFEDARAPMYHVRNLLGNTKNTIMSGLKVPPSNILIPTKYDIVRSDGKEVNGQEGTIQAINSRLISGHQRQNFNVEEGDECSNPLPGPNDDTFGVAGTFQKIGQIIKTSVNSGKNTLVHASDAAHDARDIINSARYTVPRLIIPTKHVPVVTKTPTKAMLITPRLFDISEKTLGNARATQPDFVSMGNVLDAIGISKPTGNKVDIEKIIIEPRNALSNVKISKLKKPKELRSTSPIKEWLQENAQVGAVQRMGENQNDILGQTLKNLEAARQSVGAKSIKDFLVKMKENINMVLRSELEERKSKFKKRPPKRKNVKKHGTKRFRQSNSFSAPSSNIKSRLSTSNTEETVQTQPEINSKEPEQVGLHLPQQLLHPFMERASKAQIKEYLSENGDETDIVGAQQQINTKDQRDLGHMLGAINPVMFERYFNESLTSKNAGSSPHQKFVNKHIQRKSRSEQQSPIEEDHQHYTTETSTSAASENDKKLGTIMKVQGQYLKPFMGSVSKKHIKTYLDKFNKHSSEEQDMQWDTILIPMNNDEGSPYSQPNY